MIKLENWFNHLIARFGLIRPRPVFGWYLAALTMALVLDVVTKVLVVSQMSLYQSIPLVGQVIKLTYVRNPGAAFSFLANSDSPWRLPFFIAVAGIAIVIITLMALIDQKKGWSTLVPLGLISGGATGNLLDRITVGTVVDFIDFSYRQFNFPVFNVADSAVVVGVSWLLLISFSRRPQNEVSNQVV